MAAVVAGVCLWKRPTPPQQALVVSPAPAAPVSSEPLRPLISKILNEGPELPYLKVHFLIRELPRDLNDGEVEALLGFIGGRQPAGFQDLQWGSLVNDIEAALTRQELPRERVFRELTMIFHDGARPVMLRDYALQHLGSFATHLIHSAGEAEKPDLPAFFPGLVGELKAAAADRGKPWSGTALNLLDGVLAAAVYRGRELEELDSTSLATLALEAARDSGAPLKTRISALQIAARHRSPEVLELSRGILRDPASPLMLVQSAAAVVGELGQAGDVPMLETLVVSAPSHAAPALQAALRRLKQP